MRRQTSFVEEALSFPRLMSTKFDHPTTKDIPVYLVWVGVPIPLEEIDNNIVVVDDDLQAAWLELVCPAKIYYLKMHQQSTRALFSLSKRKARPLTVALPW